MVVLKTRGGFGEVGPTIHIQVQVEKGGRVSMSAYKLTPMKNGEGISIIMSFFIYLFAPRPPPLSIFCF